MRLHALCLLFLLQGLPECTLLTVVPVQGMWDHGTDGESVGSSCTDEWEHCYGRNCNVARGRKKKTKLVFLLRATRGHLCTLCLGSYNLLEMYLVLNFSSGVIFFFILLFRRHRLLKLLHKTNKNSTGGAGAKLLKIYCLKDLKLKKHCCYLYSVGAFLFVWLFFFVLGWEWRSLILIPAL